MTRARREDIPVSSSLPRLLYSERDAAVMLSVSANTLRWWRQKGDGPPYVRINRKKVGYREGDLESWLDDRVKTSTSEMSLAEAAERKAEQKAKGH